MSISCWSVAEVDGMSVGVVRFDGPMEALSSAVLNGGDSIVRAAFIMQVEKNYETDDPRRDAERVRDALGLPEDSLGMMTAAEVGAVFNVRGCSHNGMLVQAFATAGLSNHVVAGEVLDDYDEKSAVSARRAREMVPGTINVCVVSPVPLTAEGKVNMMIPLVEAKTVALAERGFLETGTTSDSMAVISPIGGHRVNWSGTGSDIGIAAARAVSAAVGYALDRRNEHPAPMTAGKLLGRLGLGYEGFREASGSGLPPQEFRERLDSVIRDPRVSALADIAWSSAARADSLAEDGSPDELEVITGAIAEGLGVPPAREGGLLDRFVDMLSEKVR